MKTSSKSLDKCQVKVSVTLDAEEMKGIVKLFLMAAEGKETFYEQFGFHTRPYGHSGAGMDQILRK